VPRGAGDFPEKDCLKNEKVKCLPQNACDKPNEQRALGKLTITIGKTLAFLETEPESQVKKIVCRVAYKNCCHFIAMTFKYFNL